MTTALDTSKLRFVMPFEEFRKEVQIRIDKGMELTSLDLHNDAEMDAVEKKITDWMNEVTVVYHFGFNIKDNVFLREFQQRASSYDFGNKKNLMQRKQAKVTLLSNKIWVLKYQLKFLSVCDRFVNPDMT